jgi:anti-sigma factor RsiW
VHSFTVTKAEMTPDFNHNDHLLPATDAADSSSGSVNAIQRDRFELLSAYLDGEVTAIERRQVEDWLTHDLTIQRLHSRLLKLRQGFQALPVPTEQSTQQTVSEVLARVNRRPDRRWVWGGAAVAATLVGALGLLFGGDRAFTPQIAKSPQGEAKPSPQTATTADPLLLALDKPLVGIAKPPAKSLPPVNNDEAGTEANEPSR